jgi:hypothetical protein
MTWGSAVELETKRRIDVSLWAYAYEYLNHSVVDDYTYDRVSAEINPEVSTGNDTMDAFFRDKFEPYTGMWIYGHPEKPKLKHIALKHLKLRKN